MVGSQLLLPCSWEKTGRQGEQQPLLPASSSNWAVPSFGKRQGALPSPASFPVVLLLQGRVAVQQFISGLPEMGLWESLPDPTPASSSLLPHHLATWWFKSWQAAPQIPLQLLAFKLLPHHKAVSCSKLFWPLNCWPHCSDEWFVGKDKGKVEGLGTGHVDWQEWGAFSQSQKPPLLSAAAAAAVQQLPTATWQPAPSQTGWSAGCQLVGFPKGGVA